MNPVLAITLIGLLLVGTCVGLYCRWLYRTTRPGYYWRKAIKEPWFAHDQATEPARKWFQAVLDCQEDKVRDAMLYDLWQTRVPLQTFFQASLFSNSNGLVPNIFYARFLQAKDHYDQACSRGVPIQEVVEKSGANSQQGGAS